MTTRVGVIGALGRVGSSIVEAVADSLLEVTPTLAVIGPFDADRDFSSVLA